MSDVGGSNIGGYLSWLSERQAITPNSFVVHIWGQWSSDHDDYWRHNTGESRPRSITVYLFTDWLLTTSHGSVTVNLPLPCQSLVTLARALWLLVHLCQQLLQYPCVHFTHVFSTRYRRTNVRVGSRFETNEKCQTSLSHVHPPSVHRSGSTLVAEQLWVKRRPCQAACVSEWTTGLRGVGIHERWGNVVWRNVERLALENPRSLEFLDFIDPSSVLMDVAQLGTTFSLVYPGFATVEFALWHSLEFACWHHEQWSTAVWWRTERSNSFIWRNRSDSTTGRFLSLCPTETPNGVENLLDHLRTHFEPIEVFRRGGRIVDDFVCDFERQPGEEIRQGLRDEIQHFVETLRGSDWTSESFDQDTRARTCNEHPE